MLFIPSWCRYCTGNAWGQTGRIIILGRCIEETCERVDDETEDHGDHRDEDPMREPLVLHAAVDGDGRLVALEQTHRQESKLKNPEM